MNITLTDISIETADTIVKALADAILEGKNTMMQLNAFPMVQEMLLKRELELTKVMDQVERQARPVQAQHFDMREADSRNNHDFDDRAWESYS